MTRERNTITIHELQHPKSVSQFLYILHDAIQKGYSEIKIVDTVTAVFPNACVPVCGIIDHYKKEGIVFDHSLVDPSSYLVHCGIFSPFTELQTNGSPFDKIYYYNESRQVATITQTFIDYISHQTVCKKGVLDSLTWCINEVMDNVLVHSQKEYGFVMAQYHQTKNRIAFCIYDDGIGISQSLYHSKHRPKNELDALSLAIQEGIGDGLGQGNGLFGLYKIVLENKGQLTITSGASSIMINEQGEMKEFTNLPYIDKDHKGTIVDFQLDLNKPVDIKKAFHSIGGYDGFDIRIDNMLNDEDYIDYDIFKNSEGTATRQSGAKIRNDVENILNRNGDSIKGVILDFKNVKSVSSSFIDELVAKLVLHFGIIKFNYLIRLSNMSDQIAYLCERSIYLRIHDTWNDR